MTSFWRCSITHLRKSGILNPVTLRSSGRSSPVSRRASKNREARSPAKFNPLPVATVMARVLASICLFVPSNRDLKRGFVMAIARGAESKRRAVRNVIQEKAAIPLDKMRDDFFSLLGKIRT